MSKKVSYKKLARLHNVLMEYEKRVIEETTDPLGIGDRLGFHCYSCGNMISTVKLTHGETATNIKCNRKGCKSIMLRNDNVYKYNKELKDTYEWWRPDLNWLKKNRDKLSLLDHIFKGGLILRKIRKK